MPYRCPVCPVRVPDETHLADHLAIKAIVAEGTHEEWLSEHVPEWSSHTRVALGETLATHLTAIATSAPDDPPREERPPSPSRPSIGSGHGGEKPDGAIDPTVLEEAERLTRAMTREATARPECEAPPSATETEDSDGR